MKMGTQTAINSYRDLIAWQKAFAVGLSIHRATRVFPTEERFGLTAQLRRGAIAMASNIAEGYGRGSTQDYLRFLRIARGAMYEVDTQLLFAEELRYFETDQYDTLKNDLDEVERVLAGLIRSIESKTPNASPTTKERQLRNAESRGT